MKKKKKKCEVNIVNILIACIYCDCKIFVKYFLTKTKQTKAARILLPNKTFNKIQ